MTSKSFRRSESGQYGVEFALVIPVFMLVLFGVIDLSVAYYKQQVATSAAREAARLGRLSSEPRPSAGAIAGYARDYIDSVGLDPGNAIVTVNGAGGDSGSALSVQVDYPADLSTMVAFMIGNASASDGTTAGTPTQVVLTGRSIVDLE